MKIFLRETKPCEFDYERKTFSYWKRNRYLSNSSKLVCSHCNESKSQDMVMTETHIGEIPSFLLAKQVVRVISYSLFHFHLFFGVIVLKKAAKKIYPQFSPVKQRWCLSSFHFNVESNSYSVWFCVSTFLALYWNTCTTGNIAVKPSNRGSLTHVFPRFTLITWLL